MNRALLLMAIALATVLDTAVVLATPGYVAP